MCEECMISGLNSLNIYELLNQWFSLKMHLGGINT